MSGTSNTHSTSSTHSKSIQTAHKHTRGPPSRTSSYALSVETSELSHNDAAPRQIEHGRNSGDSSGYAKSTSTSELLGTAPASESGTTSDRKAEAENRSNDTRSSGSAAPKESGTDGVKNAKIQKWIEDTTSGSTSTSPSSQRGSSRNDSPSSFTSYDH
ncbi:hypothetical protein ACEPAI_3011 [Sanghuangporus weigelae]